MENSTERFFKGFSLEDYRLQVLMKRLEKEKKQCLNRLKEETHVFKMSSRLPVKCGGEYWSQYGEKYHANGDQKEKGSATHLSKEYKEDLNNIAAHLHSPNNSKHRTIVIPSNSPEHGLNQNVQRSSLQQVRSRSNGKNDSKKKTKPPDLTLLEILCADVEHGVLLLNKAGKPSDSSLRHTSSNLGDKPDKQDKHSKKAQFKGFREKRLPSDSDKSLKSEQDTESNIRSQSGKDGILETVEYEAGDAINHSRSKSITSEVLNSDNYLKTSSFSSWVESSQENVPFQEGPSQNLSWTLETDSTNSFGLGYIEKRLQSTESQEPEENSKQRKLGSSIRKHSVSSHSTAVKNGTSMSSGRTCLEHRLKLQTPENHSRFVHFKEGCELTKKGKKQSSGLDKSDEKEKFNRTKSPDVKLFQVKVPETSQRRKSQEEINKETREKMDQFFAKVERTINFQISKPTWRYSSGSERGARVLRERKNSLESGKRQLIVTKEGYRRAQPWPIQVWS